MNTTYYHFTITALNPISHIGKRASTGSMFNTEKVNGKQVPYITGSAGKGVLRRLGMEVMLSSLGLDPDDYNIDVITENPDLLTQNRLEVLFNGSILRKGGGAVAIDEGALLSELIPWFAVVGGCLGNVMMQGRIAVMPMILHCEENLERLGMIEESINMGIKGDGVKLVENPQLLKNSHHYLQRQEFTHSDDFNRLGSPAVRLLSGERQKQLAQDQQSRFVARQEPGYQDKEESHVQMRFSDQTIAAMSKFYWQIATFDLTPLMEAAFFTTMSHFLRRPFIGGNRRQGMGYIHIEPMGRSKIVPAKADQSTDLTFNQGDKRSDLYQRHLTERRDEIIEALRVIAAK